jgi:chemotaxis protein methyltransferase WspC
MPLLAVEMLIRDRLGLDPAALGPTVCPRAVENRMRLHSLESPAEYLRLLEADPLEVDALAAELVVPETWFFRGGRPLYDRLADFVSTRFSSKGNPVQILSMPCSSGEEPYSLVIALNERAVSAAMYHLDAIDLCGMHIAKARAGVYGPYAFREGGKDIRPCYFRGANDRWTLLPHIRELVHFQVGNAISPGLPNGNTQYDLLLCRNLFIYLTPEARNQAIENLERLIGPDGLLCLTPAEADRLPAGRFVPEGPVEFGIYRRSNSAGRSVTAPSGAAARQLPVPRSAPVPRPAPPAAVEPIRSAAASLEAAREFADRGELARAREICEQMIRSQVELCASYTLLGVIHQAESNPALAADAFRKALYLDPGHAEAITHMIVLCETRGDGQQAAVLRKRLQRLAGEGQP